MDSLREKAKGGIMDILYDVLMGHSTVNSAINILDLPSLSAYYGSKGAGVVAKKECPSCEEFGLINKNCELCHGTGFIVREMNKDEAIEMLKTLIGGPHKDGFGNEVHKIIKLSSGERVEIKEGE